MSSTSFQLREHREKLILQAGELVGADNAIAPDKREEFDRLMGALDTNQVDIEGAKRVEQFRELERTTLPETQRVTPRTPTEEDRVAAKSLYERSLSKYLRGCRMQMLDRDEIVSLESGYRQFSDGERRQMSTLTNAAGGFVVPEDIRFYGMITAALKFFGGVEAAGAEVINTADGRDLPFPKSDDTGNVGAIVAEEGSHTGGTTPTLGQTILQEFLYSTKELKVSWQLIQDAALDIEAWLGGRLGERLGRIQNTHFTTGDASSKPNGVITAATVGRQAAVGNTTTWPFDDVFRVVHSVDPAYRNVRCRWMMHDNTIRDLRLAKGGDGRYLWPELGSVQVGQPAMLAGYPVIPNNDVATMSAAAKAASFGDHFNYKIRRVRGITVLRLDELYASNGQVAFLAFQRADGDLIDAGTNPIKLFQNSAT